MPLALILILTVPTYLIVGTWLAHEQDVDYLMHDKDLGMLNRILITLFWLPIAIAGGVYKYVRWLRFGIGG